MYFIILVFSSFFSSFIFKFFDVEGFNKLSVLLKLFWSNLTFEFIVTPSVIFLFLLFFFFSSFFFGGACTSLFLNFTDDFLPFFFFLILTSVFEYFFISFFNTLSFFVLSVSLFFSINIESIISFIFFFNKSYAYK